MKASLWIQVGGAICLNSSVARKDINIVSNRIQLLFSHSSSFLCFKLQQLIHCEKEKLEVIKMTSVSGTGETSHIPLWVTSHNHRLFRTSMFTPLVTQDDCYGSGPYGIRATVANSNPSGSASQSTACQL